MHGGGGGGDRRRILSPRRRKNIRNRYTNLLQCVNPCRSRGIETQHFSRENIIIIYGFDSQRGYRSRRRGAGCATRYIIKTLRRSRGNVDTYPVRRLTDIRFGLETASLGFH